MDLTGKELGYLTGNKGRVLSMGSSSSLVWSGASDKKCLVWSSRNPRLIQSLTGFGGLVTSILCVDKWVMWIGAGNGAIRCYSAEKPPSNAVFPASKAELEALVAAEASRKYAEEQERAARKAEEEKHRLELQKLEEEENQRKRARKREKEAAALEELERAERAESERLAEIERQKEEERKHQLELKKQELEQVRQAQIMEQERIEEERHQQEMQRKREQVKAQEEARMRRQQQQQQLQEAQHQAEMQRLQASTPSSMPRPHFAPAPAASPYFGATVGGGAPATPSFQNPYYPPPPVAQFYPTPAAAAPAPAATPSIIMMPQPQQPPPPQQPAMPIFSGGGLQDNSGLVAHLKESIYMLRAQLSACQENLNSVRASHARDLAVAEDNFQRNLRLSKQQFEDEGRRLKDDARANRLEADALRGEIARLQSEVKESKSTIRHLETSLAHERQNNNERNAVHSSRSSDYRALREEIQQSSDAMHELKVLNSQIRQQLAQMSGNH